MPATVPMQRITTKIYLVRGQKVMLDKEKSRQWKKRNEI